MQVSHNVFQEVIEFYNSFILALPPWLQGFINIFILMAFVLVYAIVIWKFYKYISKKDIIDLNLSKHNKAKEDSFTFSVIEGALYLAEYIIVLPFIVFLWFSIFTFFLILMASESMALDKILILSAVIIAVARAVAYYKKSLAEDISKLIPLTILAAIITDPEFLSGGLGSQIINSLSEIPAFLNDISIYLGFIILLEIILRTIDFVFNIFKPEDDEEA
ncbi:MAG: hypothetical protein ACOC3Z_03400 [Nanoarchaeota archaeon]